MFGAPSPVLLPAGGVRYLLTRAFCAKVRVCDNDDPTDMGVKDWFVPHRRVGRDNLPASVLQGCKVLDIDVGNDEHREADAITVATMPAGSPDFPGWIISPAARLNWVVGWTTDFDAAMDFVSGRTEIGTTTIISGVTWAPVVVSGAWE